MAFVVVIEPNPLLRIGILHLLSKGNIAMDFADYNYAEVKQITCKKPSDLVILSISCTDNISHLAQSIDQVFSPTAILLLSDTPEAPASVHGASSLIAGCIYRHAAPEVLQASAQLILAGGRCFPSTSCQTDSSRPNAPTQQLKNSAAAVQQLPSSVIKPSPDTAIPLTSEAQMLGLTPRQYEVLVLLARGYPMKTVGRHMNISVATAKAHTESLYQRLEVKNRNAAVYTAIARGATLGWQSICNLQQENS